MKSTYPYVFAGLMIGLLLPTIAQAGKPHPHAITTPSGGKTVAPGMLSAVLVRSASRGDTVLLRITSGPLAGAVAEGRFSDNAWVCVEILHLRTNRGTEVRLPACNGHDQQGKISLPGLQVVREEWSGVLHGQVAASGRVFHLRLVQPVEFDQSSGVALD